MAEFAYALGAMLVRELQKVSDSVETFRMDVEEFEVSQGERES